MEESPEMKCLNIRISERYMFSEIPKCIEILAGSFCFVCTRFQIPFAKCLSQLHYSCEIAFELHNML